MVRLFIHVLAIYLARIAPLGRAVFFTSSVVSVVGQIHTDGNTVKQKQNEDSPKTVLAKPYMEWVIHECTEISN